jgi:nitrous oxidase accessory protein
MKTVALSRSLIIGLAILFVGAFVMPSVASATIIYVDDDNTTGPWDGTLEHPYQHIQDGVDNASSDDTVYVFNGIYYENVEVDKTLSLMGEDKDSTVIDGGGSGSVVHVVADSVSITGLMMRNGGSSWPDAGILVDSSNYNNLIGNNIILNHWDGIYLKESNYNTVSGNLITNFKYGKSGIVLQGSSHNNISGNTITTSRGGILLTEHSSENIISGNTVADNSYGISVVSSSFNNTISGNNISDNGEIAYGYGLKLGDSYNNTLMGNAITGNNYGMILASSSDNDIYQNAIAENEDALNLSGSSNMIYENAIIGNNNGINLSSGSNNMIYHNNLINETYNAQDNGTDNQWDDGYPSGGNYWSDYAGTDEDEDGIGDTPYDIPGGESQDGYPLMYPWGGVTVFVDDDANPSWYDSIHVRTIQEGVDSATDSSSIYVYNGTYYENVIIDKQIYLMGHNVDSVIVDGSGSGDVLSISADWVLITGFTIQNSGSGAGITVLSDYNTIFANKITENGYGIYIVNSSANSVIYHNNFINNIQSAYDEGNNQWNDDYPSCGNYWSDYDSPEEGAYDNNNDGLVDSPYDIPGGSNQDRLPFISLWDGTPPGPPMCGDVNVNGKINSEEIVYLISYLFKSGPDPWPAECVGDFNNDGVVNSADIVWLFNYLFKRGPAPGPDCCPH